MLKDSYASVMKEAQGLQTRLLPQIREKASTLDGAQILSMVRRG